MGTDSAFSYQRWSYQVQQAELFVVLPDGCQDILLVETDRGERFLRLADRDHAPRPVLLSGGMRVTGFRLEPGLMIPSHDFSALQAEETEVKAFIASEACRNSELLEIIDALATGRQTLQCLARSAGVSVRTLQRRFSEWGLPSPAYWRQLGRARLAVLGFGSGMSLTELAGASGFSDQAHMTREFVRWFGHTPGQLCNRGDLIAQLRAPGLGNWNMAR